MAVFKTSGVALAGRARGVSYSLFENKNETKRAQNEGEMCVENGKIHVGQGYNLVEDITRLFGHNHRAFMGGAVRHGCCDDVLIWWPTITPNKGDFYKHWNNRLNANETQLVERADDSNQTDALIQAIQNRSVYHGVRQAQTVYIFARVLPRDGGDGRRYFKGVFKFNHRQSGAENGLVWDRVATSAMTYQPVQAHR